MSRFFMRFHFWFVIWFTWVTEFREMRKSWTFFLLVDRKGHDFPKFFTLDRRNPARILKRKGELRVARSSSSKCHIFFSIWVIRGRRKWDLHLWILTRRNKKTFHVYKMRRRRRFFLLHVVELFYPRMESSRMRRK